MIYVDDARIPARVRGLAGRWSHLIADTPEELHAFAERLGLRREWFQDPCVDGKLEATPGSRAAESWHYDVIDRKRELAIRLGAKPIGIRDIGPIIDARFEAAQKAKAAIG